MQIIPKLRGGQRRRLKLRYQRERNALVKTRLLVILRLNDGESSVAIERGGICGRSTVSHAAERYRTLGELGLEDGRRFNGQSKFNRIWHIRRVGVAYKAFPKSDREAHDLSFKSFQRR